MAMTCYPIPLIPPNSIAFVFNFLALFLLLTSAHSFIHKGPTNAIREGAVAAEKTRLGSTPPSCHNKCNECDPCMAVQVPTLPGRDGVRRSSAGPEKTMADLESSATQWAAAGNRYSNYKPLGWKCRCGSRFYNP
ncbi:EPIDERMAL PATTERNING FACTOR-like protein 1 [Andrographis paniculata]|uniref:EPIDERMAL PATTERNING FACTOR-like protein 1 n=1 Tax=Andrographis paniculata TaxID=175694 RepID=UPI0021E8C7ED|nr:EPIDERMAL PATTERNING FACTOR-like protein 1 [Andrographis paniculata]